MFGADQLYLGYGWYALAKLLTLGGCGFWYLYDLVRIGSSPVLTRSTFQVAADLPHFVFVLIVLTAALLCAFAIAIRGISQHRVKKSHEVMTLRTQALPQEEGEPLLGNGKEGEENVAPAESKPKENLATAESKSFSGYGATIPRFAPITTSVGTRPPVTLPPTTWQGYRA